MPFKKGQPKIGGRKKGTPNKTTLSVFEELEKIVTEDGEPVSVVKMFFASVMDMPQFQRAEYLIKFMEFIYPRRKHSEHSLGDDDFKKALIERILNLNEEPNRTRVIDAK